MKISDQIINLIKHMELDLDQVEFGNVEFVLNKGSVIRVDIRKSIRPEK